MFFFLFLFRFRCLRNLRHNLAAVDVPGLPFRILRIRIVDAYAFHFLAVVVLTGDPFYIDTAQFRLELLGNLGSSVTPLRTRRSSIAANS